jgi:soluble lytic murein transglycosylase
MFHPQQKKNYVKAEWLSGFISFRFLDDKKNGLKHFKNAYGASNDVLHKSKNSFWVAEVYFSMNDMILAFEWYRKTYELFNTFYGQLAAERLKSISSGRFFRIGQIHSQPTVEKSIEHNFNNRKLVKVLKVLNKYNIETDIKFLSAFYKELVDEIDDPNEEKLIMNLAKTEVESEFLMSYEESKQKYLKNTKLFKTLKVDAVRYVERVNPDVCFISLVHSIIKRESRFNPRARSRAGATGLMQIMPSTADFTMRTMKFYTGLKRIPLHNVQKNLTIGSNILSRLLGKYNNNLVYVLYAYNAGEGNLSKFLRSIKNLKNLTALDLIELVPIKETRIYVKNVLFNMFAYQTMFRANGCYNSHLIEDFKL